MEINKAKEEEILATITKIASKQTGIELSKITKTTTLGRDLGLDGDDAIELLNKVRDAFQVNLSDLDFDKYFNSEADIWGIGNFFWKLFDREKYIDKTSNDVAIGDLVNSVMIGRWVEPV